MVAGDARDDDQAFFGRVVRGGGAGVYLLVDGKADPAHLRGGWTTVHEFIHLGMPYVQDPWMSEGFASPAMELLRHLDAWYGKPVFTPVVRRHLGSRRFPDVS